VGLVGQSDLVQDCHGGVLGFVIPARALPSEEPTCEDVLECGQLGEGPHDLECPGDALVGDAMRSEPGYVRAVEAHGAAVTGQRTGDHIERGGLT
jgi:hypothetical protein